MNVARRATPRPSEHAALPGRWNDLIVFCAGISWDSNRGTDQHMAERLAHYAPLLYVDPPISHATPWLHPELAESVKRRRLRLLAPQLARLTPLVLPGKGRPGMRVLTKALTRRTISRAVCALGGSVHAVVVASLDDSFVPCGERHRVLYATDDFVAGAEQMGLAPADLERDQRRRLAEADIVITSSAVLADKWAAIGKHPTVVRNGVDDRLFVTTDEAPYPEDVRLAPPIAGFVGHISDRIDFALLEAVASRGRSVLLVGPRSTRSDGARLDRLLRRPNVQWVGARPFASLPSYLRLIDVGLVPYQDSAFNRASFPLKTLEYLAAGRAVVATDLPAIRSLGTHLVNAASSASTFVEAVDRELVTPRSISLKLERQAFARQHGWDQRAAAFARAIGL